MSISWICICLFIIPLYLLIAIKFTMGLSEDERDKVKKAHKSSKHSSHKHEKDRHSEKKHSHEKKDKKDKKDKKEKKDKKDRNEKDSYPFVKISGSEMLFPKISIDDYFNKNHEFRLWLKISEKMNFEDLTSNEAKELFEKDFVKDYNKGRLPNMYYTGDIPLDMKRSLTTTQHKWNFKINSKEQDQLRDLTENIEKQTNNMDNSSELI